MQMRRFFLLFVLILASCSRPAPETPEPEQAPVSILLITLDTTRADAIGPATPAFNALAARDRRYTQAYASTPQTLPSHTSMMTGIKPRKRSLKGVDGPLSGGLVSMAVTSVLKSS